MQGYDVDYYYYTRTVVQSLLLLKIDLLQKHQKVCTISDFYIYVS